MQLSEVGHGRAGCVAAVAVLYRYCTSLCPGHSCSLLTGSGSRTLRSGAAAAPSAPAAAPPPLPASPATHTETIHPAGTLLTHGIHTTDRLGNVFTFSFEWQRSVVCLLNCLAEKHTYWKCNHFLALGPKNTLTEKQLAASRWCCSSHNQVKWYVAAESSLSNTRNSATAECTRTKAGENERDTDFKRVRKQWIVKPHLKLMGCICLCSKHNVESEVFSQLSNPSHVIIMGFIYSKLSPSFCSEDFISLSSFLFMADYSLKHISSDGFCLAVKSLNGALHLCHSDFPQTSVTWCFNLFN